MPNLSSWNPEDSSAWASGGSRTAWRNLLVSVPALVTAFAVWMFWSVLTVRMKEAGFPFTDAQLFTLIGLSGLVGATLRIPSAFMVDMAGGRNTIAVTTALLVLPALGAGIALRDTATPFSTFVVLSMLSGIGGGNFASSMANVPRFWPKRMAGTALGLNGGLGNLGVSVMQVLTPLVMGSALFGTLSGSAHLGIYVQNGALLWAPVALVLAVAAWFLMDNLPGQASEPAGLAVLRILGLHVLGLAAAGIGVAALLLLKPGLAGQVLILLLTVLVALGFMKLLRGSARQRLDAQFAIFRNHHTWTLTFLYFGTFGSFIGLSGALPLLIKIVFGHLPGGAINPHAPHALTYAWMGAFVGSVARPVGGWMADRWGGARLTQLSFLLMIVGTFGAARFITLAQAAPAPETQFLPFLLCFLLVFVATGLGNGAVFQMVPTAVGPSVAGSTVGWISAVAAYGSYLIPSVFKSTVESGSAQGALYGFAAFYLVCLAVNGWFYLGKRPMNGAA